MRTGVLSDKSVRTHCALQHPASMATFYGPPIGGGDMLLSGIKQPKHHRTLTKPKNPALDIKAPTSMTGDDGFDPFSFRWNRAAAANTTNVFPAWNQPLPPLPANWGLPAAPAIAPHVPPPPGGGGGGGAPPMAPPPAPGGPHIAMPPPVARQATPVAHMPAPRSSISTPAVPPPLDTGGRLASIAAPHINPLHAHASVPMGVVNIPQTLQRSGLQGATNLVAPSGESGGGAIIFSQRAREAMDRIGQAVRRLTERVELENVVAGQAEADKARAAGHGQQGKAARDARHAARQGHHTLGTTTSAPSGGGGAAGPSSLSDASTQLQQWPRPAGPAQGRKGKGAATRHSENVAQRVMESERGSTLDVGLRQNRMGDDILIRGVYGGQYLITPFTYDLVAKAVAGSETNPAPIISFFSQPASSPGNFQKVAGSTARPLSSGPQFVSMDEVKRMMHHLGAQLILPSLAHPSGIIDSRTGQTWQYEQALLRGMNDTAGWADHMAAVQQHVAAPEASGPQEPSVLQQQQASGTQTEGSQENVE